MHAGSALHSTQRFPMFGISCASERVGKNHRPSYGKHKRYQKLVRRLEIQIMANPDLFDLDKIDFPPSLQANDKQRQKLMQRLLEFKHQAKIGEVAEKHWIKL